MSRARVPLASETIDALCRAALGASARAEDARELRGGTFNACWAVTVAGHGTLVLKVAPPPEVPVLTYEHELLRTEVDFYARARGAGVPVPEVVAADFGRRTLPSDYFFMTRLPGRPLYGAGRRLSRAGRERVREQLGRVVPRLATLRGDSFGYPQPGARARGATWREAYGEMLGRLLEDAERLGVRLPRSPGALRALVARWAPALDAVDAPRLVHFDLWDGNLFFEGAGDDARLGGIIDGERTFWGDPLAELASLALFGEIEGDAAFLRGWAEGAGAPLVFDEATRARVALGQLYLYAIMRVEPATRGADWLGRLVIAPLAARSLRRALRRLERG
jgi:aminoglycoside phosphotransferase (APT) family kinase protein